MTAVQQLTLILIMICIMIALIAWKGRQLERRIKALEDKNLNIETEYGSWEGYKRTKESWNKKEG